MLAGRSARLPLTTAPKKPKGPVNVVIDSSGLKVYDNPNNPAIGDT